MVMKDQKGFNSLMLDSSTLSPETARFAMICFASFLLVFVLCIYFFWKCRSNKPCFEQANEVIESFESHEKKQEKDCGDF